MIGFILFILTAAAVGLHALAVWAGYHLLAQRTIKREDWIALGSLAASGLLHIINFIR